MKILPIIALIFLLSNMPLNGQDTTSVVETSEYPLMPYDAIAEALMGIKMTPEDMTFRIDYIESDHFRLPIIDSLTLNPLRMADTLEHIQSGLTSSRATIDSIVFEIIANILTDYGSRNDLIKAIEIDLGPSVTIAPYNYISYPDSIPDEDRISLDQIITIADDYFRFTANISTRKRANQSVRMWDELNDEELAFLRDTFAILILENVEDEFRPVEELDSLQKWEEGLSKRAIPILSKLHTFFMYLPYQSLLVTFEDFKNDLLALEPELDSLFEKHDWQIEHRFPAGKFAIGGWGPNEYNGKYLFIIDFGGDDIYRMNHVDDNQVIFDIKGNDTYIGLDDYCLGAGFFNLGLLYDGAGDDIYRAKNFSLGSGLFGTGILIDKGGHDSYQGDTHTLGAGTWGIGLLFDHAGNDFYNCALFGQAYAGPVGFGSVIDLNGNDNYFAGGKYKDFLRYEDHFLSLSQGFSFGVRPRMSGGVAILIDSKGNDIYTSDIFGQAASYWYGLGAIYDASGNDKYLSFQYAQGNGTHLSLGILMDKSGDDYYFAKGVSQGCGHDLAAGFLIDYDGNDTYQSFDLSQAAGSANGIGMLIDYRGNDSYEIKRTHNTQGYGNPRRDYGSIGLFMDLMGEDNYIGNGTNNRYWIIKSKWGIGMDLDWWEVNDEETE